MIENQPTIPKNYIEGFEKFLRLFQDKNSDFKYLHRIQHITSSADNILYVDFNDLLYFNEELALELKNYPDKYLYDFTEALRNVAKFSGIRPKSLKVRIEIDNDLKSILFLEIGDIRSKNAFKLFSSRGIITKTYGLRHYITKATFQCNLCGNTFQIIQLSNTLSKPRFCTNKRCKASSYSDFSFIGRESKRKDIQRIIIEELPEVLRSSKKKTFLIESVLQDDLVEKVNAGDRVHFIGIYKPELLTKENSETPLIEIHNIKLDNRRDDYEYTKEEEDEFLKFSKNPNILEIIAENIAPHIFGRIDEKKAIILSLASHYQGIQVGKKHVRGIIHVILIGDPSTGKTEVSSEVQKIDQRCILTSGKNTTTAGLTATAVKDERTGRWEYNAGAVVLGNFSTVVIDEFDKMRPEDQNGLNVAMSQGIVPFAKAGLITTLNANTGIIACANPKYKRYNKNRTVYENINIPHDLLSRFDLSFIIIDEPKEEFDRAMTKNIRNLYLNGNEKDIDNGFIAKYFRYLQEKTNPKFSEEIFDVIDDYYHSVRKLYDPSTNRVSILIRHFYALLRLSLAHAKLRLSDKVEKQDFEAIIPLFTRSLKDVGYDEITGKLNIDPFMTPSFEEEKRGLIENVGMAISDILENHTNKKMSFDKLSNLLRTNERTNTLSKKQIAKIIDLLVVKQFLRKNGNQIILNKHKDTNQENYRKFLEHLHGVIDECNENEKQKASLDTLIQRLTLEGYSESYINNEIEKLVSRGVLFKTEDNRIFKNQI